MTRIKVTIVAGLLCLLLQAGCYVRTHLDVDRETVPSDFSPPVLVVTVQESIGLDSETLAHLEQQAIEALAARGIRCISLEQATSGRTSANARELLRNSGYRALLEVVVKFWGSRSITLSQYTTPTVESLETDRGSLLFEPGSIEETHHPGPTSSYKQVAMVASVVDLQSDQVVWSGDLKSGPGLVGRSFIYHHFNRSLEHEQLARRCFGKLAGEIAQILPKESGT
ncbi:MAG: hypothetical protein ACLFVT_05165 [Syntrophobacteria bacterium]